MGMYGYLCTLSPKRLALIAEDPEVLDDVLDADAEVPGLLALGKAWNALDILLSDAGRDALLGDAILARSGQTIDYETAYDPPRVLTPARAAEISTALAKLPKSFVRDRFARLAKAEVVHGEYGRRPERAAADLAELEAAFGRVAALYAAAAASGHAMLAVVT